MWVHFGHHIWRILWTRLSVVSTCVNKLLMTELLLLNSTCLILISIGVTIHLVLRWQIVKWTLLELLTAIVLLLHIHHSIVVVVLLLVHKIVVIVYIVVVVILVIVVLVIILTLVVVELSYCS